MKNPLIITLLALSLGLAACDFNGGTEQGRCVAFDEANKTVTMVVDSNVDQLNPSYSGKVDTFTLPENPLDVGPLPVPGGLLMVEIDKNKIMTYDPETKSIRELPVEFVKQEKDITPKSPQMKGKTFPLIDKANSTVTVYVPRLESLVTFKVDQAELAMPAYTWELGDEVRIAFRKDKPGQAIRYMNVSKTNIFTR